MAEVWVLIKLKFASRDKQLPFYLVVANTLFPRK